MKLISSYDGKRFIIIALPLTCQYPVSSDGFLLLVVRDSGTDITPQRISHGEPLSFVA